jgi:glycosyltransferase involved in cell wall biosynthesis
MGARVAMNLMWCVPGVGGSEQYLVRQLLGLSMVQHDFSVVVFAPAGFSDTHQEIAKHFEIIEAPSDCVSRPRRVWLEHTWLASRTKDFDLVHHGGGTIPRRGTQPTVLTLHDVQWTEYPDYVKPIKRVYLRSSVPSSLRRATHVTVPSQFVAGSLVQHFGLDRSKISVVPHGLEFSIVTDITDERVLRERYGMKSRRVIFFPAITHPHKNHLFLLDLMANEVGGFADPDVLLVCAGAQGNAEDEVARAIEERGLSSRVLRLGHVNAADRNGLIQMAEALVFPSEYEGFGAPVIEAMALGTPVICSDRTSLPEVVGDAGVVIPLTREAWGKALHTVRMRRSEFVQAGYERSQMFTVATSAEALIRAYQKVLRS